MKKNTKNKTKAEDKAASQNNNDSNLSSKLDKLTEIIESQSKEIERLKFAADKKQLRRFDSNKSADEQNKIVRIGRMNDKYIVGWESLKSNKVRIDKDGYVHEDIRRVLIFEDGSKQTYEYSTVEREMKFDKGVVLSETRDKDGNLTYEVLLDNRDKVEIDSIFVNP